MTGVPGLVMEKFNNVFQLYDRNFTCSRSKLHAIVKGTFLKKAISVMEDDLKDVKSVAICFDSTTMRNTRMLTIFAKFYKPSVGHITRCIDLRPITNENHQTLSNCILDAVRNASIDTNKVSALISDNAPVNLGGVNHAFGDNVATRLQVQFGHELMRIGCQGHITNNALKKSFKQLNPLFNVKRAINKTFSYFNQKPIRRDELRKLKGARVSFVKNFVPTRWLSAYNSLNSLLPNFEILRAYFSKKCEIDDEDELSDDEDEEKKENTAQVLNEFYSDNLNFVWVDVLEQITYQYFLAAAKIQGADVTIMEGLSLLDELLKFCQNENRKSRNGILEKTATKEKMANLTTDQIQTLVNGIDAFLKTSADYIRNWLKPYEDFKNFEWILFPDVTRRGVFENQVLETIQILKDHGVLTIPQDLTKLKYEVASVTLAAFHDDFPINSTAIGKWNFIFDYASRSGICLSIMEEVIAAILSLSPSNAISERIFSEIKHFWTDRKSTIDFLSILAHFMIKYNLNLTFDDFLALLSNDQNFLETLRANEKYEFAARSGFSDETDGNESLITKYFKKELLETEIVFEDDAIYL